MTRRTVWFFWAFLIPTFCPAESLTITINLYDLAGIANPVLAEAIRITDSLYGEAGVDLRWVRQPIPVTTPGQAVSYRPKSTPVELSMRLLGKELSDQLVRPGSPRLGVAYHAGENNHRYLATVMYDRVERTVADLGDVSLPFLLGHLIAHEIGHLLLGPDAHKRTTLMACPWDTNEFRTLKRGRLRFNQQQKSQLRSQVTRRVQAAGH